MARRCAVFTGPASSTGSPTTLMMRPSVSSPTGTAIGWPVSVTSWPRTRPSEESIAIVRTVDSPRCCATSSTRRLLPFLVSSAFRIGGRSPWNWTSTTAPMTWVILPTAFCALAIVILLETEFLGLERLGAGDDLDQLLGNHRLAGAVIGERLLADHFAGIAGGVVHGAHARALLGGGVFQERAEYLHRQVARQQLGEDVFLGRLVFVGRGSAILLIRLELRRDYLLRRRDLRDHRPETREEQRGDVESALVKQLDDLPGDHVGLLKADLLHAAQLDDLDDVL